MSPDRADQIPVELRELVQWVAWRTEHRADAKGELKPTKVPINLNTERRAETDNPETWGSFDLAVKLVGQWDGIGFVFTPEGEFAGVDLDGCRCPSSGVIAEWAWEIIRVFNTYTEVSPSGTGVKLFFRGRLPKGAWKKKVLKHLVNGNGKAPAVECYDQKRFFTVTAQHLEGTPLELADCTEALSELQARFAKKKAPLKETRTAHPLDVDDETLLTVARSAQGKAGERFCRLFDRGDTADYGGDNSAADLALCNDLRFYCAGDAARMDRMFRQSALMRPKWDERRGETTYGQMTIQTAQDSGGDVYTPPRNVATSAADPVQEVEPPHPVENAGAGVGGKPRIHNTDLGNARRLVHRHGGDLRYSRSHGWLYWDRSRWRADRTGEVMRRAKETVRSILAEASKIEDDDKRKAHVKWAMDSQSRGRLEAMVKLAESESEVAIEAQDLDADPWLLNCLNGTLNLKSGQLQLHRREDLITKQVKVHYDPEAQCPTWDLFMLGVTGQNEELIDYLCRWAGYSLTGDVSEQMLLFLHGLGANGKSTFLRILLALLGDYAAQAAPGLILEKKNDRHPTEIADLMGRRLVVSVEVGEGKRMAEELLKQLTGGDRLKGRLMRCDFVEFDPQFKLMLAANHKPIIRGTDHAIWRRIPLVPFDVTFTDDHEPRKDPQLLEKLMKELPGVLAWAVRGCQKWRKSRLTSPVVVKDASTAYRQEMDVIADFLTDCCKLTPDAQAKSKELRTEYCTWCELVGEKPISQKAFGDRLKEKGCKSIRMGHKQERGWQGIGICDPSAPQGGVVPKTQTDRGMQTDQRANSSMSGTHFSHERENHGKTRLDPSAPPDPSALDVELEEGLV